MNNDINSKNSNITKMNAEPEITELRDFDLCRRQS